MQQRIPEIDLLRSLAILLMIVYHTAFDLRVLYNWQFDLWSMPWETLRIITGSLFLFLSGVSANFSTRPLRRALVVLGCALLITIATYIYDPNSYIRFGILHCIGIGMLLLMYCKRLKEITIPLGIVIVLIGNAMQDNVVDTALLLPLGFLPPAFTTLDYYPLLPWFGVMLIGMGIGHFLYVRKHVRSIPRLPKIITFPGRHALLIYMVHQPILLVVLNIIM